jgi:hypothetical protein
MEAMERPGPPASSATRLSFFRTTGEFSMETRSVSEGPSADSGDIVTCGERGVPRWGGGGAGGGGGGGGAPRPRFGLPKTSQPLLAWADEFAGECVKRVDFDPVDVLGLAIVAARKWFGRTGRADPHSVRRNPLRRQ